MRAIELNAVQVEKNKQAFEWGRRAAHAPQTMAALLAPVVPAQVIQFKKRDTVDELLARRVEFLTAYQNAAYAEQYRAFVQKVQQAEGAAVGKTTLSETVARYLFKLMAYKDEYEVARLHSDTAFLARVNGMFEGDFTLNYHLAPPATAKKNAKGELLKKKYGPSMLTVFKLLAKLKGLRGTKLDVFGYTEERKTERKLIADYEALVAELLASLSVQNHPLAIKLASIPDDIRGYGHVKDAHLAKAKKKEADLLHQWRNPEAMKAAAE